MSVLEFLVYENGSQKRKTSSLETVQFAAIEIGTTPLPITEVLGHFDFGAKILKNLGSPTNPTDAATLATVTSQVGALAGTVATRELDNLSTTALNAALIPGAPNSIDLGTSSVAFRDLFVDFIKDGAVEAIDISARSLSDTSGIEALNFDFRELKDQAGAMVLKWQSTYLSIKPEVRFLDADSSNYVGFKAANVVPSNVIWTLPSADAPVAGYVLSSNAAGVLSWVNPLMASPTEFSDALFRITDDATPSKKIAFQASGISASTTRTITMPDADVDLGLLALRTLNNLTTTSINADLLPSGIATRDLGSGLLPWDEIWARSLQSDSGSALSLIASTNLNLNSGQEVIITSGSSVVRAAVDDNTSLGSSLFHWAGLFVNSISAATDLQVNSPIDMSSNKITNLGTPTNPNDAVTKAYADALTGSVSDWKLHVRVATSADIALTGVHPLVIDSISLDFGNRVLVKSQTAQADNGIYDYTDAGGGNYALVRSSDANAALDLIGAVTFVNDGVHARKPFYMRTPSAAGAAQLEDFDFTGLTGASFDVIGAGLKLNLAGGLGYVWFNVTDGVNAPQTDPGGVGTSVQVDIVLADNATAIAFAAVGALSLSGIPGLAPNNTLGVLEVQYAIGALSDGDAGTSGTVYTLVVDGADEGLALGVDPIIWSEFGSSSKTEYRTLTGGEITAKAITLVQTPAVPSEVILDVIGGTAQFYGDDFTVTGNSLGWSGLGLDGVLIAGDKVRVIYHYY